MAIPAVRFDSLTKEYNIAATNFAAIYENNVLNSPEVKDAKEAAQELMAQLKNNDVVEVSKDILKSVTRVTQDVFGTFVDLAKLPETTLTGIIDDIFPSSTSSTKSLLKGMVKTCRNDALGRGLGLGIAFNLPKCNGFGIGIGKCPPNLSADILNKATGNFLNQPLKLLGNILKQIVSLGGLGFNANLCGVFAAITQGITDRNVLGAAAGILLNQEGVKGNIQAVFDISKSLDNFPILSSFPKTISNIAGNFIKPLGAFQNGIVALSGMTSAALGAIDESWDISDDGIDSVAELDDVSDGLGEILEAGAQDKSLDIENLEELKAAEKAEIYAIANNHSPYQKKSFTFEESMALRELFANSKYNRD